MLAPNYPGVPQELIAYRHFVLWKAEIGEDGKPTKILYNPNFPESKASSTNPKTWRTFAQARRVAEDNPEFAGIGFVFSKGCTRSAPDKCSHSKAGACPIRGCPYYKFAGDPFTGVDLDHCRDPKTGEIEQWAMKEIKGLDSYTEISPSGTGVHVFVEGQLPPGKRKKGNYEMYSEARYFTMTGHHLPGTPTTIEARQTELEALHKEIFKPAPKKPASINTAVKISQEDLLPPDLSDDAVLIARASNAANGPKFSQLWGGDTTGYGTLSEATAALLQILVFWCGPDPGRIDQLFRQSGLMREKWDRPQSGSTWGALEIQKAIARATAFYQPAQTRSASGEAQAVTTAQGLRLTDWGAAKRFVNLHGQDLHYCFPWGKFLVWDGRRWTIDQTGQVRLWAKDVPGILLAEAATAHDPDQRKALAQFAFKCEGMERQKAFLTSAQSEPGIPILPEQLDPNPWLFNVLNGTLDLRTGELHPHRRENLITKLAPVEYDPQATCPTWLLFLNQIFCGNQEVINFVQKAVGYALTGDTREQCLFFLYGTGSNGKSTLLITLHNLFGDYAKRTSTETFLAKKGGQIPNDIAALRGARFVGAVEVAEGRRLAEVVVKEMTGGDLITARFLHAEFFEFRPEFKIFLAVNHRPVIKGTDHAIWRRIRLIPFTVEIPQEQQDRELPEKLKAELPGILNWFLAGCLQWRYGGLAAPQAVVDATEDYRSEMDTLGGFLQDHCILTPGAEVMAAELFKKYLVWAEASGEKYPLNKITFGMKLRERGFVSTQQTKGAHKGLKKWVGIGLRAVEA